MLNLDINFLFIILESCLLEFCGALLNHPIDLAHSFKILKNAINIFSKSA